MIIVSASIFLIFLGVVISIYGIPTDISHIYTLLPEKIRDWVFRLWFPAFLVPVGVITLDNPIVRVGLILIFGVAMFPEYWEKKAMIFHVVFAMGGILTVMTGIIIETKYWYIPVIWAVLIFPLTLNLRSKVKWLSWYYIPNKIFWVEFSAFVFGIAPLALP